MATADDKSTIIAPLPGRRHRHSGGFEPGSSFLFTIIAILVVFLASGCYAYAVHYISFFNIAAVIPFVFGAILGYISHKTFLFSQTRNMAVGYVMSVILGLGAIYFSWLFAFYIFFKTPVADPVKIWQGIQHLLNHYTIRLLSSGSRHADGSGIPLTGAYLGTIYILEAVIIFVTNLLVAKYYNQSAAFCEQCRTWCKQSFFTVTPLSPIENIDTIIGDLLDNRIDSLLQLTPGASPEHFTQLVVSSCLCGELNLLSINDIKMIRKVRKIQKHIKVLCSNLVISPESAEALSNHFCNNIHK